MCKLLKPYDFAYFLLDGFAPILLGILLKFFFAVEEEGKEYILTVGLLLLETVVADGRSDAPHGDGWGELVDDTLDGY